MANENKVHATGTYDGVEFYIDPYWRFYVPSLEKFYDSHTDMREAVDRANKAKQAQARRKPMSIPIVTLQGERTVIVGVHAGHGKVIVKPPVEELTNYSDDAYPDVPWIVEAIEQEQRLKQQAEHIKAALKKVAFNLRGGDSRYGFDASQHGERVAAIERLAAEALKRAEKTNLEKLLQQTDPPKRIRF